MASYGQTVVSNSITTICTTDSWTKGVILKGLPTNSASTYLKIAQSDTVLTTVTGLPLGANEVIALFPQRGGVDRVDWQGAISGITAGANQTICWQIL